MKIGDGLLGLILLAFGAVVIWHVQSFPNMPGHYFGPGLYPTLSAAGLVICGGFLLLRGLRTAGPGAFAAAAPSWSASPHGAVSGAMMLAAILAFIFLGEDVGFQILGFVTLLAFYLWLGRGPVKAVAVAAGVTLALDLLFRSVLHVAVPSGPLTGLW